MNYNHCFIGGLTDLYIEWRKSIDTWTDTIWPFIYMFEKHCLKLDDGSGILTQSMMDSWCRKKPSETNNSCRARINASLGLVRFLISREKSDVVIPDIVRWEKCTYIPVMMSHDELGRFFHECDNLKKCSNAKTDEYRKLVIPVIFRFLYSTGVRPFEARWLHTSDVNLEEGIVNINRTKRGIQHQIMLHESMLEFLRDYSDHICNLYPDREYFFPGISGSCVSPEWLRNTFSVLLKKSGGPKGATVYSFRHKYATENLNRLNGSDPAFFRKYVMLSKSMGHTCLKSTQYYYQKTDVFYELIEEKTAEGLDLILPDPGADDGEK